MNSEIEKKLWEKTNKYIKYLEMVPFLKMVAVCNNLAFGKVDEKSDIDLFVIAKKGRLFIVRTFITLILHVLGVRRHGKKIAGRFCLSFFIDEEEMNMEKISIENDIYLAYWVKTMIPIIDDGVSLEFAKKNTWINQYFFDELKIKKGKSSKSNLKTILNWILNGRLGNKVEEILKKWQKNRARKKMINMDKKTASLVITDHILKFHNVDRRMEYRNMWISKYKNNEKITNGRIKNLNIK